ncbi:hypothetical protein ACXR2U_06120 [Jatrophihabitans sp. YIM 134969]
MLIRPAELEAIRRGEVDLAFRRWERPRLLPGTRMRTKVGLLEVTGVDRVAASAITADDARRAGSPTRAALLALLEPRGDRPKHPIWRVGLRYAGDDPRVALRDDADLSADERSRLNTRLDRLDASSRHGAWTREVLALIAANPARRAPDLAELRGLETVVFKRDVRKLKELGLTESLEVGYRISPRGEALLHGDVDA